MLNKEKFAKKIVEIACERQGIAVVKGKLTTCHDMIDCKECIFYDNNNRKCNNGAIKEWANSEYVEPPVDWSKVAVDTPILVKNSYNACFIRRHFAKYENGKIYAWCGGLTSWSLAGSSAVNAWEEAKLAESEE